MVAKAFPGINPVGIVESELSLAPKTCFVGVLDDVIAGWRARFDVTAGHTLMMLDATEAGEPLYRKFGFVEWAPTADLGRKAGPGIE